MYNKEVLLKVTSGTFPSPIFTGLLKYLAIYILCCLFVSNKRLNRSGPNFFWDLTLSLGRVMNDQNFKNLPPTKFVSLNFENFYDIREHFFCFVLQCIQSVHVQN